MDERYKPQHHCENQLELDWGACMEANDLEVARGVHAKGKPVELYIAAYCMLARPGDLSVSTSFIDDEGVDLVFNRWGRTATLALQVKSRFADSAEVKRGDFIADVNRNTFQSRKSFYVLFAVADPDLVELDPLWLIPSEELDKKNPGKEAIRFKANINTVGQGIGQWDSYALRIADSPRGCARFWMSSMLKCHVSRSVNRLRRERAAGRGTGWLFQGL